MSDNTDHDDYDLPAELGGGTLAANGRKPEKSQSFWQRKRHMLLIGAGVLFFGAIIADRLVNMYGADELPDTVQIQRESDTEDVESDTASTDAPAADIDTANVDTEAETATAGNDTSAAALPPVSGDASVVDNGLSGDVAGDVTGDVADDEAAPSGGLLNIEAVFGSPLVFVSASEPLYVITEDDRRFDLGSAIDEQTTLAGVTGQNVILDKDGNLLVVDLPQPSVK